MRVGYTVSTPWSRFCEHCEMWAALAYYDAIRVGPVAVSRLPR